MSRIKVLVSGRVQGVFYRAFVKQNAEQLGLSGWVKNRRDGRVAAEIEGNKEAIKKMLGLMRHGPSAARVDNIQTADMEEKGSEGFEIIY